MKTLTTTLLTGLLLLGAHAADHDLSALAGTRLRFIHFLSITGYSLFGNVIALLASYLVPFLWYICFPLFSVGSALSMAWLFYERTPRQNWARAIAALAIVTHVLFTLHLRRFARDAHIVFAPGPAGAL